LTLKIGNNNSKQEEQDQQEQELHANTIRAILIHQQHTDNDGNTNKA